MHIHRKRLVLATALAGSFSLLAAGCGDRQPMAPKSSDSTTTTSPSASTTTPPANTAPSASPSPTAGATTSTPSADASKSTESGMKAGGTTAGIGNDDAITGKVKAALVADQDVRGSDINVVTRNGAVQLSGSLESQAKIDQAIAIVSKVEGVTSVASEMTVKS
jgi:hypothetical protein